VLSASFVPVYARLRAEGREADAAQLARSVGALLAVTSSLLVLAGIVLAPALVTLVAGGFPATKQAFTVELVRILFPGMAALVLAAWCLGVLNAHRKFFVSYTAPVAWNVAIIVTLVARASAADPAGAARLVAVGALLGSGLQFAVQLPWLLRFVPWNGTGPFNTPELARVLTNFVPVLVGRGVVQLSGWLDQLIASFATAGAASVLFYAQNIALLPVSVFGMAVSASELTEMSGHAAAGVEDAIRTRLQGGLRAIAFFVVPSSAALLVLGDVLAAAVLQTGRFVRSDTVWVWAVLAGSSVGLLAGTLGRLYNSAWYALHDTRTPVRFALVRIAIAAVLGSASALVLPGLIGIEPKWGVAGLTLSAGVAAWIEYALLRRSLNARIGWTGLPSGFLPKLWVAATVAAGSAFGVKLLLGSMHPVWLATIVFAVYGTLYFALSFALGVTEAGAVLQRIRARLGLGASPGGTS
jgi:putative peptidoglycan lipid II flippase